MNNKQKYVNRSEGTRTTQNGKLNERHVKSMLNRREIKTKPEKKKRRINIFPSEIRAQTTKSDANRLTKHVEHNFIFSFAEPIFSWHQKQCKLIAVKRSVAPRMVASQRARGLYVCVGEIWVYGLGLIYLRQH